jgi:hypothetical protein
MVDLALLQSVSYIAGALGVCIAAIYYVMNMKATLQTRQTQLFMQMYNDFHNPEFLKRTVKFILLDKYLSKDFMKYDEEQADLYSDFYAFCNYLEGIGLLVKKRLIDPSLVDDLISGTVIQFWEKYGSNIKGWRVQYNYPNLNEWVEYLYGEVKPIWARQHPEIKSPQ